MSYPNQRLLNHTETFSDLVEVTAYQILQQIQGVTRHLGYDSMAFGDQLITTTGGRPATRPFIIGLIPPDVDVNFVAVQRELGTLLGKETAIAPPPSAAPIKGKDGKVKKGGRESTVKNIKALPPEFWPKFKDMCARLGINPEDMLVTLIMESNGMDPSARPGSGPFAAKGLNQLIYKTATGIGMPKDVWDQYEKYSAVDQLPWVEKYFATKSAAAKSNDLALYASNIGGGGEFHASKNPDGSLKEPDYAIYKGHKDLRPKESDYPPGTQFPVTKQQEREQLKANIRREFLPIDATLAEIDAFESNKWLTSDGKNITMFDINKKIVLAGRRSEAFRVAVEAMSGADSTVSTTPVTSPDGSGSVMSGIVKGAADITDIESDDPMTQIGRHISPDRDRQVKFVDRQVQELNDQIRLVRSLPSLVLMVNPSTFGRKYEHQVDYAKGRRRPIVSMWHEKPAIISGRGSTAGQYAMASTGDGGLTNVNRIHSLSYANLMSLIYLFRNNGMIRTTGLMSDENRGIPLISLSAFIYYDGRMYIGSFDNLSVSDSTDKPHRMEYDFSFTCRYEVQPASSSELSLVFS